MRRRLDGASRDRRHGRPRLRLTDIPVEPSTPSYPTAATLAAEIVRAANGADRLPELDLRRRTRCGRAGHRCRRRRAGARRTGPAAGFGCGAGADRSSRTSEPPRSGISPPIPFLPPEPQAATTGPHSERDRRVRMPLVGEQAGRRWAYNSGDNLYTASWDIDFAPRAAFIKVFLGHYFEFDSESAVDVGLINIRFRDANGVDQTIAFPDIDAFQHEAVQFNSTMTHVTFGMKVKAASASVVYTLGFWN